MIVAQLKYVKTDDFQKEDFTSFFPPSHNDRQRKKDSARPIVLVVYCMGANWKMIMLFSRFLYNTKENDSHELS